MAGKRTAKRPAIPAAVREWFREAGRSGGQLGGPARAKSLSAKRRREIASKAAAARWGERKGKGK